MAQDFENDFDLDMQDIEKRARALRAETARNMAKAISAFFCRVVHLGSTKPVATNI